MGITYICGRAGSGKTTQMLGRILETARAGEQVIVMVPEQMTLLMELAISKEMPVLWNIQVLSPSRLIHMVRSQIGGAARIMLDVSGRAMALRRAFSSVQAGLSSFRRGGEGLVLQMVELLTELKTNEVDPTALRIAADGLEGGLLKDKLYDIAAVYDGYNELLAGKYLDGEDAVDLFCEHAASSRMLKEAHVFVDGFDVLPNKTIRQIFTMAAVCKSLTISFKMDAEEGRDEALFAPVYEAYERLHMQVLQRGIPWQKVNLKGGTRPSSALAHLERELYAAPAAQYKGDVQDIELVAVHDPQLEAERTAGRLFALLKERGYRFNEMAVVCADLSSYGAALEKAFERRGISAYVDDQLSCAFHPAARYVLYCLEAVSRGFKQADMLRVIKTGYSPLSQTKIDEMELYMLENGIQGRKWDMEIEDARLSQMVGSLMKPLRALREGLTGKKSVRGYARELFLFVEQSGLKQRLNRNIRRYRLAGDDLQAERCLQVWDVLIRVLDQAVELCGDSPVSLRDFIQMLRSGLDGAQLMTIPQRSDQVYVGTLMRFKPEPRLKVLCVVGVNEDVIPAALSDEGLLRQDEKEAVRRGAKEQSLHLPGIEARAALERFVIYTALSAPLDMLIVSYSMSTPDGKVLRVSPLIRRLQKLFPGLSLRGGLEADPYVWIGSTEQAVRTLEKELYDAAREPELSQGLKQVYAGLKAQGGEALGAALKNITKEHNPGQIDAQLAKRLYAKENTTSISRVESFASCAFMHFVSFGLRPRAIREQQVSPIDRGNIYHAAMENFIRLVSLSGKELSLITRQESDALMDLASEQVLRSAAQRAIMQGGRGKQMILQMRRTLHKAGFVLLSQLMHSKFTPVEQESAFGMGELSPVSIEMEGGERISVAGRIDRVDMYKVDGEPYIRVIDYKSGNVQLDLADAFYGLQLQLFVYLDAELQTKNAKPAGVFYFKIDAPAVEVKEYTQEAAQAALMKELRLKGLVLSDYEIVSAMCDPEEIDRVLPVALKKDSQSFTKPSEGSLLDEEQFALLIRYTRHKIRQLLREIQKGQIQAAPVARKEELIPCRYCDYKGICRMDSSMNGFVYRPIEIKKQDAMQAMARSLQSEEE